MCEEESFISEKQGKYKIFGKYVIFVLRNNQDNFLFKPEYIKLL